MKKIAVESFEQNEYGKSCILILNYIKRKFKSSITMVSKLTQNPRINQKNKVNYILIIAQVEEKTKIIEIYHVLIGLGASILSKCSYNLK